MSGSTHTLTAIHSSASSEWYTPGPIVEAGRRVLGSIDLDPASSARANQHVHASRFFSDPATGGVDGLAPSTRWGGRVFLNPPSPPREWWKRLVREVEAGRVSKAVYVAYSIEQLQQVQLWTPGVLDRCLVCVLERRVRFLRERDGQLVPGQQPTHASAVIGIGLGDEAGDGRDAFVGAFGPLGWVSAGHRL